MINFQFNFEYFIAAYIWHHKRFRLDAIMHIESLHHKILQNINRSIDKIQYTIQSQIGKKTHKCHRSKAIYTWKRQMQRIMTMKWDDERRKRMKGREREEKKSRKEKWKMRGKEKWKRGEGEGKKSTWCWLWWKFSWMQTNWNKNASSRIRSARLKSSLVWSSLVWSGLVWHDPGMINKAL